MMMGGTQAPRPGGAFPHSLEAPADRDLLERFVHWQDQAAFAALVVRHGPMVLGVCRRVLRHTQEAEDAFQATFLILARKAGGLTQPERLANWLYGVAVRTARKAHAALVRRAQHERQVAVAAPLQMDRSDHSDLIAHLDEELERLPYKYRAALVLCYLEGMTNEDAARQLGWPTGSISYRLARGREILRERLQQRATPPAVFALMLHDGLAPADLPEALTNQTVQTVMGRTMTASAAVLRLVEETPSPRSRSRLAALVLMGLALLGLAAFGTAAAAGYWNPLDSAAPAGSCH